MTTATFCTCVYRYGPGHLVQGALRMPYHYAVMAIILFGIFMYTCLLMWLQEVSLLPNIGGGIDWQNRDDTDSVTNNVRHYPKRVGPWQYAEQRVINGAFNTNVFNIDALNDFSVTGESEHYLEDNVTSARFSRYGLVNSSSGTQSQVGDVIHFVIESRDTKGNPQMRGGDIWTGVLSDSTRKAYTAGKLTDFQNGTYLMTFVLAWSGKTRVEITLIYPSTVTKWMRTRYRKDGHIPTWHGTFQRGTKSKITNCYLTYGRIPNNTHSVCVYKNNRAWTLTKFFCRKPAGFTCDNLVEHRNVLPYGKITANIMKKDQQDIFEGVGRQKTVVGSPVDVLNVDDNDEKSSAASRLQLDKCGPNLPVPVSDGYWINRTWTSLVCKPSLTYSPSVIRKCLKNCSIHLTGDSTVRQWFFSLTDAFNISIPGGNDKTKMMYRFDGGSLFNFNLTFTFHPLTYHRSFTVNISKMRFETDVLLNLPRHTCNHVVVISPWAHFITWPWEAYIEWLTNINNAIMESRKLCPEMKVIVKSPHPIENTQTSRSMMGVDILFWDMKLKMRDIFEGSNVTFIDTWDMDQVYPQPNDLHMTSEVVNQEIGLLLSYICP